MNASDFFERTLEEIIIENKKIIQQRGFPPLYENTINQYRLPCGKKCDILSYEIQDKILYCKIFELKRAEIGIASLLQIIEYGKSFLEFASFSFPSVIIELHLIGSDISYELLNLCFSGINVKVTCYTYQIDGIHFEPLNSTASKPAWIYAYEEVFSKPSADKLDFFMKSLKSN